MHSIKQALVAWSVDHGEKLDVYGIMRIVCVLLLIPWRQIA